MTLSFAPSDPAAADPGPSAQELEQANAELARQLAAQEAAARAARAAAERKRLESELGDARARLETQQKLVADLHERFEAAQRELPAKSESVAELERRLAALDEA